MQADPMGVRGAMDGEGGMVWGGDINNPEPGLSPGLALSLGHQCNGPVSW